MLGVEQAEITITLVCLECSYNSVERPRVNK